MSRVIALRRSSASGVAVGATAAVLALLIMIRPVIGLAALLLVIAGILVLISPLVRLSTMVFGALFVLGSSSDVSGSKVVYAAAVIGIGCISMANLARNPPVWFPRVRLWLTLALALAGSMVISTMASPGSDPTSIVRQGLFYLLIPIAPLIGVETGRSLQPLTASRLAAFAGALSAVGFAVDWLTRRGVAAFNLPYLVFGSTILAGLAFALSILLTVSSKGPARVAWGAIAAIIPIAMLVTGTRTNLVMFVVILGMLGSAAKYRLHPARAVVAGGIVALALGVLLPIVARAVLSDQSFLDKRVYALLQVLSGDAAGDQSYQWRAIQYNYAWEQIGRQPWLGYGLGWNPPFAMDTPLVTVIKLGVIGTALMIAYLVVSMIVVERLARARGYSPMHTAARGLALMTLALLPFGSPLEDRGFPFALALVFAGVAAAAHAPDAFRAVREIPHLKRMRWQRRRRPRPALPAPPPPA